MDFQTKHYLFKYYKSQSPSFKTKVYLCMIMQSHAANASRQFLERKGISGEKLIILPPARPDLTPYGISS